MSESQFGGLQVSSLCSLLTRPVLLTGVLRGLLIQHFAAASHIEEPALKHLVWKPDESSPILIESVLRWDPRSTQRVPAVIIKRNAYQNQRIGIADRHQGPATDKYGGHHFSTYWVGSHTLFCIGGTGRETEYLASEVERHFSQFAWVLQANLKLHRLQLTDVGEVSILEESTQNFVVPVTLGYAYEDNWVVQQVTPLLKRISLSVVLGA